MGITEKLTRLTSEIKKLEKEKERVKGSIDNLTASLSEEVGINKKSTDALLKEAEAQIKKAQKDVAANDVKLENIFLEIEKLREEAEEIEDEEVED